MFVLTLWVVVGGKKSISNQNPVKSPEVVKKETVMLLVVKEWGRVFCSLLYVVMQFDSDIWPNAVRYAITASDFKENMTITVGIPSSLF